MFDVIVIGSDLGSLVAALIAARYGRKVVLVTECGLKDCIELSGYTFNIDPFPWSGFGPGQIFAKLLSELHIPPPDPSRVSPLNPALQVILPDHRIDLFMDRNALIDDIGREYPDEDRQIQNLFETVTKGGITIDRAIREAIASQDRSCKGIMRSWIDLPFLMGEGWRLARKIRSFEKVPSLSAILDSQLTLFSSQYVNHVKPVTSAYLLSLPLRGLYYHFGGKRFIIDQLWKRFEDLRGEIRENVRVGAIRASGRIEVDVQTKGKSLRLLGQKLVISVKTPALEVLLAAESRLSRLGRRLHNVEARWHPFTLHMGVDNLGLPDRMSEYVIYVPTEKPNGTQGAGPFLFLESSIPDDRGLAPSGKRMLTVTSFLPLSPLCMAVGELKASAAGMIRSLEDFLPFLQESIDFMDMERSIEISRTYQQVVNPRYRFTGPIRPHLMTLPLRSPLQNVLLTGGLAFAALGFEGEVLSGMKAGYLAAGGAER